MTCPTTAPGPSVPLISTPPAWALTMLLVVTVPEPVAAPAVLSVTETVSVAALPKVHGYATNQYSTFDCPAAIVPTYWLAACPPPSVIPLAKPEMVARRLVCATPEELVTRKATYAARGPSVHGLLLSSVSCGELIIATVTAG